MKEEKIEQMSTKELEATKQKNQKAGNASRIAAIGSAAAAGFFGLLAAVLAAPAAVLATGIIAAIFGAGVIGAAVCDTIFKSNEIKCENALELRRDVPTADPEYQDEVAAPAQEIAAQPEQTSEAESAVIAEAEAAAHEAAVVAEANAAAHEAEAAAQEAEQAAQAQQDADDEDVLTVSQVTEGIPDEEVAEFQSDVSVGDLVEPEFVETYPAEPEYIPDELNSEDLGYATPNFEEAPEPVDFAAEEAALDQERAEFDALVADTRAQIDALKEEDASQEESTDEDAPVPGNE